MSQHADDTELPGEDAESTEEPQTKGVRQRMRQLEEEATRGKEAERKLAFIEAGFKPEDFKDPNKQYFLDGYKGEVKAESIRQAAVEGRFLEAPAPATPLAEQEGLTRMTQVAAGGSAPPAGTDWVAEINKAQTQAEVKAILAKAHAAQS